VISVDEQCTDSSAMQQLAAHRRSPASLARAWTCSCLLGHAKQLLSRPGRFSRARPRSLSRSRQSFPPSLLLYSTATTKSSPIKFAFTTPSSPNSARPRFGHSVVHQFYPPAPPHAARAVHVATIFFHDRTSLRRRTMFPPSFSPLTGRLRCTPKATIHRHRARVSPWVC
jgi:hypothetical protein